MRRSSASLRWTARSPTRRYSRKPSSRDRRMSSRRSAPWRRTSPIALALVLASVQASALKTETLRAIGSLPPHIVGLFEEPLSFQQASTGVYYVFDRRAHSVYTIDPA